MKCVGCKKEVTSGELWALFTSETYVERAGVVMNKHKGLFVFCTKECREAFFLSKDRMNKRFVSLARRVKDLQDVREELQDAWLATDNEDTRDLIDCLRRDL
jgi:hypothetical protein